MIQTPTREPSDRVVPGEARALRILILDGDPAGPGSSLDGYVSDLEIQLSAHGHQITRMRLRDMELGTCSGCYGCWVKTPGECVQKDDIADVHRAYLASDLVIFTAPILRGFISALLKGLIDRLIALAYPFVELVGGECMHVPRYDRYPDLACLWAPEEEGDEEDARINLDYFERTAHHFRSPVTLATLITTPIPEVIDAFDPH